MFESSLLHTSSGAGGFSYFSTTQTTDVATLMETENVSHEAQHVRTHQRKVNPDFPHISAITFQTEIGALSIHTVIIHHIIIM